MVLFTFLCLSFTILDENCKLQQTGTEEESRQLRPRGYGYAHPFLPFLEPLSILAVLGFLAFLIQTFHAIYHTHNNNAGLGGLLNNVLPGPGVHKKLQPQGRRNDDIFKAIQFYEELNKQRRKKKRSKFLHRDNVKSPTANVSRLP